MNDRTELRPTRQRSKVNWTRLITAIVLLGAVVVVALFVWPGWANDDDKSYTGSTGTWGATEQVEDETEDTTDESAVDEVDDTTPPDTEVPTDTEPPADTSADDSTQTDTSATPPANNPTNGTSTVNLVNQSNDSLDYPSMVAPDPDLQPVFPDVPYGNRPALVGYESPFEDGDFCDNTPCGMDVPQYYYRVMSAGQITIPELGVDCVATDTKGCLVIVVNHFGETSMFRNNVIDHGFTVAGRVWDMSTTDMVTLASQALADHYVGRMTLADSFNQGANCGTIDGCDSVEWHVVVIGNGSVQVHWSGLYSS